MALWASTCTVGFHMCLIVSHYVISAKLLSCLDQLHSILGESLHEPTAVTAIIQSNFDTERALDHIFSQGMKYILTLFSINNQLIINNFICALNNHG